MAEDKIKSYFSYGVLSNDRDLITSTTTYAGLQKRYFSSLDAEVFIGGERIVDIVRIDFSYEERKMPYYGFNSFVPSKIFVGQKLVQGTFAINFTEAGYIAKVLQNVEKSSLAGEHDLIGQACSPENAPLFGQQFDILVGYGGYNISNEASLNNTYLLIQGVSINGYQQILDVSGEPVLETYSFIAKAIQFNGVEYPSYTATDAQEDSTNAQSNRVMMLVEKHDSTNVKDLIEKCNNNKNILGFMINVIHSLHSDKDATGESHIYVDFEEQFNTDSNNKLEGEVSLTISDNKIDLSKTYNLTYTPNTKGHYGVRISKEDTQKIEKVLRANNSILCALKFKYVLEGESKTNHSTIVFMRRGLNY